MMRAASCVVRGVVGVCGMAFVGIIHFGMFLFWLHPPLVTFLRGRL